MTLGKWNETGRIWEEDNGWLDEEQLAVCERANESGMFRAPVPTRMVSNGEYMPVAQTNEQKRVEARIGELADTASRKLAVDRRRFLAGSGGMAASFLAMNEVFGHFFDVAPIEMFEPAAYAESGTPKDLFVFDDQLHFVRGSQHGAGGPLRAIAQGSSGGSAYRKNPFNPNDIPDEHGNTWGAWNPALAGIPADDSNHHIVQFIKDVYLDSQVNVGILTNVTASLVSVEGESRRPARNVQEAMRSEILTAAQTAAARNFINEISGSTRMLAHGLLYVGKGNLEYLEEQIGKHQPDAWKGYNISYAAKVDTDPMSPMRQWRHDDEEVAYPSFELIRKHYRTLKDRKPGFNNICVHKGLAPGPPDPVRGHPADLPKAMKDWPDLNFITYHACIQPAFFMGDSLREVRSGKLREGVPDISWTTEYTVLVAPYSNAYAEIGTTWASSVITFPTVAAHIMGQLMKFQGADRIVFGSDSVWYGSPQWQIDALWRFQIPEVLRQKYGYPELTQAAKRKILGLNSAKLHGIKGVASGNAGRKFKPVPPDYERRMTDDLKNVLEMPAHTADKMARFKERYVAMGGVPDHTAYGFVRTRG
ncbi:MAG: amidohydrolase family protein [Acidobacteriota bacterium]